MGIGLERDSLDLMGLAWEGPICAPATQDCYGGPPHWALIYRFLPFVALLRRERGGEGCNWPKWKVIAAMMGAGW